MSSSLKNLPASQRPRSLSILPTGGRHFQRWRTLRWYLLLLIPVLQSAVIPAYRSRPWPSVAIAIAGLAVTTFLFAALASGMTSTNWGTWFRTREPLRYWLDVFILAVAYVAICTAGWYIK